MLPAYGLRYAISIWYLDTQEALADYENDKTNEEETDEEKTERMQRVMEHLGIDSN